MHVIVHSSPHHTSSLARLALSSPSLTIPTALLSIYIVHSRFPYIVSAYLPKSFPIHSHGYPSARTDTPSVLLVLPDATGNRVVYASSYVHVLSAHTQEIVPILYDSLLAALRLPIFILLTSSSSLPVPNVLSSISHTSRSLNSCDLQCCSTLLCVTRQHQTTPSLSAFTRVIEAFTLHCIRHLTRGLAAFTTRPTKSC